MRTQLTRGDMVRLKAEYCFPSVPRDGVVLRGTKDGLRVRVEFPIAKAVWLDRSMIRKLPH